MFNPVQRVLAQIQEPGPIVTCGPVSAGYAKECDKEQFFTMVHVLIKYAIYLSMLAVTVAIVYAAFMYIISAGEMEKINKAKGAIKAAIIGLVIVLTGWILVNTVLGLFGCSNWNVFSATDVSTVCN